MNINQLAVFHAVAAEGSITRAAERLRISQPAVSKQLRELERSFGMALFHRLSKGVRLTDAGEMLAGYARQIFALEAEAERALEELRALERGRLRVGAGSTIGTYVLPPICARFQQQYPGIALQLEIANTDEIQRRLVADQIDLAFTEGLEHASEFRRETFMSDEVVPIAAPEHPLLRESAVTAAQLCAYPVLWREAGSGTRAVAERALAEKGLHVKPVMSLGSTEAIKRAVAAGTGLAFVSHLAIEQEVASGQLKVLSVTDLSIQRSLHRLRLRGKYESRAAREFLRLLRESVVPEKAEPSKVLSGR